MQIEQPKRQRESLSSGVMVQEQKRKKDTQQETERKQAQEKEESQAKPRQTVSEFSEPEPPGAVGGMVTEYVKEKERQKQRERSLTRSYPHKMATKDLGIIAYFKRNSPYNIERQDKESRDILREAMIKGKAKVQWRNPNVKYEYIHTALLKGTINMNEIRYVKCSDKEYDMVKARVLIT